MMDWQSKKIEIEQLADPYDRIVAYVEFVATFDDISPESQAVDDDIEILISSTAKSLNMTDRLLLQESIQRRLHPILADALARLI